MVNYDKSMVHNSICPIIIINEDKLKFISKIKVFIYLNL
jgi:hypothetical protein